MYDGIPTTELRSWRLFDLAPTDSAEDVRRDVVLALSDMGFEIEASHHEVADSQHEIDFKYGDALITADRVITFKFATKSIALPVQDCTQTQAKPMPGINGSGMHTHGSLAKNGKNAFYDPNGGNSAPTPQCITSGVPETRKGNHACRQSDDQLLQAPSPRLRSPLLISWSAANHSALVRVPAARGNGPVLSPAARTRCATRISRLPVCFRPDWTASKTRLCLRKARTRIFIISMKSPEETPHRYAPGQPYGVQCSTP